MQSSFLSDIGECAVAVVAIELVLAVVGEVEILKAVIVIVADAHAARPAGIGQSGFFGDVGECAVAVVVIEAVAGAGRNAFEAAAAEDESVHPTIIVVVKEGAARTV